MSSHDADFIPYPCPPIPSPECRLDAIKRGYNIQIFKGDKSWFWSERLECWTSKYEEKKTEGK